jgi:hypothetical protein
MRRIGEQSASERLHPGRWVRPGRGGASRFAGLATRSASALLVIAARTLAGDGDGPELTPPSDMPVVTRPTSPGTAPAPTRPPVNAPGGRAVLALPGMIPPPARPSTPAPTLSSTPTMDPIPGELMLDAPIEMRAAPAPARPATSPAPGRSARPQVLESSPMDEPLPIDGPGRPSNAPSRRSTPPSLDTQPSPQPQRRPRLFGLLPGQSPAQAPTPLPSGGPSTARSGVVGRSVAENLKEDPAVESALKRRVEKQAREAVGDRARSIEVRIVGKNAMVQARGVKFYQKRGVRKSLESIPALSGLRSTIEIVD